MNIGVLDKTLFIKVSLPPLDKKTPLPTRQSCFKFIYNQIPNYQIFVFGPKWKTQVLDMERGLGQYMTREDDMVKNWLGGRE